jgi:hypothetical protein
MGFLAVAELHRVRLITVDEPFVKKAGPHYPDIHLLAKWRMN